MRKLLQSKAVVAALIVIAAVAVASNFVSLPKLLGVTASARNPGEPSVEPAETSIRTPPVSRFVTEQQMWRELFPLDTGVRDPFAPPAEAVLRAQQSNSATAGSLIDPVFILQAISHEPGRAYAVVNQHVLAEGDRLAGYTVERIHPASVDLRGPQGLLSLTLRRTAARQKPSTGNPADADLPATVPQSSIPGSPR